MSFFIPCFVDLMYPQVAMSIVRIFEWLDHKVVMSDAPECCVRPAFNSG